MTDLVRAKAYAQKKSTCYFAGVIEEGADADQIAAATGTHLLANLPPDTVITDAYVHVITASDAATSAAATLGTTDGGSEIATGVDLKTTGDQGTFAGQSLTTTGKELWLNITVTGAATTVGEYLVVVEYLEYTKKTGEYTSF